MFGEKKSFIFGGGTRGGAIREGFARTVLLLPGLIGLPRMVLAPKFSSSDAVR